jgi:hypothetical protein
MYSHASRRAAVARGTPSLMGLNGSKVRNPSHLSNGALVLGLTGAAMLFFLLCIWLLPDTHDATNKEFVIEVVREYAWQGSTDQRWGYFATLILVASLCGATTIPTARRSVNRLDPVPSPRLGTTASVLLSFTLIAIYGTVLSSNLIRMTALIVALHIATVMIAGRIERRTANLVIMVAITAYVMALIIPGFFAAPISALAIDPNALSQFENHFTWLTLPGSAISAGQNLYSDIQSYGLLWPAIISVIDHAFGRFTIGDQMRFVQITQALFCLCAVCAYFAQRPRSYAAVLVALLLAAPFWTTAGLGIWHPNQTGYRSLGFPLGFLVLVLLGRVEPRAGSWALGAMAAVATLINVETAAAISIGYLVYLGLRTRSLPIMSALRMVIAGGVVFAIFFIAWRLSLGRLPISFDQFDLFYAVRRFTTGGFGLRLFTVGSWGENYFLVPIALLMVVHCIYVLLLAFFRLGISPIGHREAFRASVAATLLVWLSYYFNAPNWWQIWTELFLYGFLLIDLIDLRLLGIGVASIRHLRPMDRWSGARIEIGRLAVLLLLALAIPFTNSVLIQQTQDFLRPTWLRTHQITSVISGVKLPQALGDALETKAQELERQNDAAKGNLLYLTFNTAFIPVLTGLFEPQPFCDLWSVEGEADFQAAMAQILARKYTSVLIDAPDGPLAVTGERAIYENRWRAIIARDYIKIATEDGWEVWQRRD